mmetsp:Transcript_5702/g.6181  ORF Transcript_5702/g.6181 Transcript_5702/m.6181 type:complete len:321 (+) Transcript_5702:33-995(+)
MTSKKPELKWVNPREAIWGFHVHQELPKEQFGKSLVIQENCSAFLKKNGIEISANASFTPGYGPHLAYMWELRVEEKPKNILEQLGLAISFMAINRFGLSAYIHPLTHDDSLEDDLETEGRDNQNNTLWFSYRVDQKLDFFFHPPRTADGKVVDTRTKRVMSQEQKDEEYKNNQGLKASDFLDPFKIIQRGFHIHMDYKDDEAPIATQIYDNFLSFLESEGIKPTSHCYYKPGENGPHIQGGWEVKFETTDPKVFTNIGIAVSWLMCNRQGISIFMHPVTWQEGQHRLEYNAHDQYAMFIGDLVPLDLTFFTKNIPNFKK